MRKAFWVNLIVKYKAITIPINASTVPINASATPINISTNTRTAEITIVI